MKMNKMRKFSLAAALLLPAAGFAIETPTMGWSSWNTYRVNISADIICAQADAMASNGLKEAGYSYINIDDGFFGGRDEDGRLLIHPTRFPEGLKPVVDHIHSLGFKAGIYSDAGHNTCGNYWDKDASGVGVGLYEHDDDDANYYFNELKFDFIKIDFCGGDAKQNTEGLALDERERYTAIRQAIDCIGREDVRINVCRWAFPGTWVHEIGSSWRIAGDIGANWASVKRIIEANKYLSAYAGGGHYNDMDMLEIGRGLSDAEERTHFGMWCMMSSPLLIGCDLTKIPQKSLELITNPELIALDQDPVGLQAYIVSLESGAQAFVKDIETLHGTTRAVAFYNSNDTEQTFSLKMSELSLGGEVKVHDVFTRQDKDNVADGETFSVTVGAHDTAIFRLEGETRLEQTVYEAEAGWLERFQNIGKANNQGHANYSNKAVCSGGGQVGWLGNHAENYLEWRDVWTKEGGAYELSIYYLQTKRKIELSVNGGEPQIIEMDAPANGSNPMCKTVTIALAPGSNTIRIANPTDWAPDIDCIKLTRIDEGGEGGDEGGEGEGGDTGEGEGGDSGEGEGGGNEGEGEGDEGESGLRNVEVSAPKVTKIAANSGIIRLPAEGGVDVWGTDGVRRSVAAGQTELHVAPGLYFLIPTR